jgi:polysaccharide biosynthesis transport protein
VISRATVSNVPAYPKKLPSVLIASVATMMLCCGFVLTRELLSIPGSMPAPPLVARPAAALQESAGAAAAVAEAPPRFVAARNGAIAEIVHDLHQAGAARIAVLGAAPGMKSGETAIKLARALAKHARVILVGIEAENSAIQNNSRDPSSSGAAELIAGTASFGDVIGKDKLSRIHVISAGRSPIARIALLSSPRLAPSFDALARSYDYVVADAGLAEGVDLEAIAEIAPHAVLLADAREIETTEAARERLLAAEFDCVTVLASDRARGVAADAAAA